MDNPPATSRKDTTMACTRKLLWDAEQHALIAIIFNDEQLLAKIPAFVRFEGDFKGTAHELVKRVAKYDPVAGDAPEETANSDTHLCNAAINWLNDYGLKYELGGGVQGDPCYCGCDLPAKMDDIYLTKECMNIGEPILSGGAMVEQEWAMETRAKGWNRSPVHHPDYQRRVICGGDSQREEVRNIILKAMELAFEQSDDGVPRSLLQDCLNNYQRSNPDQSLSSEAKSFLQEFFTAWAEFPKSSKCDPEPPY